MVPLKKSQAVRKIQTVLETHHSDSVLRAELIKVPLYYWLDYAHDPSTGWSEARTRRKLAREIIQHVLKQL